MTVAARGAGAQGCKGGLGWGAGLRGRGRSAPGHQQHAARHARACCWGAGVAVGERPALLWVALCGPPARAKVAALHSSGSSHRPRRARSRRTPRRLCTFMACLPLRACRLRLEALPAGVVGSLAEAAAFSGPRACAGA